ncbi:MAG: hypothetical protein IJR89_06040 [Clostridia bacterium]|nr:hypothetical protein [Clostridia bacterium]
MKRVTLFCGHYGSGKTNVAVNFAKRLALAGRPTALADIDVVNPYFRSADSRAELEALGVRVIALPFANTNVDLPALPSEVYGLVERRDVYAVLDVGGDDRGAFALGRFTPYILEENDYEMLLVVNFFRPLTRTAKEALDVMREIERAAGIPFTGIVNNSNLGEETTAADVEGTAKEADRLVSLAGLPLVFTSFDGRLSPDCERPFSLALQPKII